MEDAEQVLEKNTEQKNKEATETRELFTERKNFMNGLIKLFKNENFDTKNGKVISIDGEWGIGKTFFKEKLKDELKQEKFIVLEYNAWENDYNEDPFPSLVGNMVTQMESFNKSSKLDKVIKNVKINGWNMMRELMPLLVVGLAKHFGLGEIFDVFEEFKEGTKIVTTNITEVLFDYNKKDKTIEDFKNSLSEFQKEYIKGTGKQQKIVILIDELDRCRPDYALKVLERIKHFFNVENYVFIILNNKDQIVESVNSAYGISEGEKYLEKFYDLEINLPEPNIEEFLDLLLKNNIYNKNYDDFEKMLFEVFKFYFKKCNLSLRIIEKSFIYYKTIIDTKPNFRTVYQIIFFPFIFSIKIIKNKNYKQGLKGNQIYSLNNTTTRPLLFEVSELLKIYSVSEFEIHGESIDIKMFQEKIEGVRISKVTKFCTGSIIAKGKKFEFDYGDSKKIESYFSDRMILHKRDENEYILKNGSINVREEDIKFIYDLLEMFDFKNEETEEI